MTGVAGSAHRFAQIGLAPAVGKAANFAKYATSIASLATFPCMESYPPKTCFKCYPFTAPPVRPETRNRFRKMNRITGGTVTRTAPAIT